MLMFSRSLSLTTSIGLSLVDNFDELKLPSDSVLPHVRTDIVDYLKGGRGVSVGRMQLDYIKNPLISRNFTKQITTKFNLPVM